MSEYATSRHNVFVHLRILPYLCIYLNEGFNARASQWFVQRSLNWMFGAYLPTCVLSQIE